MNQSDRFIETIAAYHKHDWQLRRVLLCEATRDAFAESGGGIFEGVVPEATSIDALWFARPSHGGLEAWELRLVGETPYALFEAFDADIAADLREEKLREMQLRMAEYAASA